MQREYGQDGHGLPSDFPSDPIFPWEMVLGVLGLFLLAFVLFGLFIFFQRLGRQMVVREYEDAIVKKADLVSKALSDAARATSVHQEDKLRVAVQVIDDTFGKTLTAAAQIGGAAGKVTKGVEGKKVIDAKAAGLFPNGAHVHGNTIINIAVNNGEVAQGAPPAAGAVAEPAPDLTPQEKHEIVWEAIQRIFDYWKYKSSVVAAMRAVRQQLDTSPPWSPPRQDGHMMALGRRDEQG